MGQKDLSEKMDKKISSIQEIIDNIAPKLNEIFFLEMFKKEILCFFCWIYETMEYKNYGKVKELDIKTTRGLGSNFSHFVVLLVKQFLEFTEEILVQNIHKL